MVTTVSAEFSRAMKLLEKARPQLTEEEKIIIVEEFMKEPYLSKNDDKVLGYYMFIREADPNKLPPNHPKRKVIMSSVSGPSMYRKVQYCPDCFREAYLGDDYIIPSLTSNLAVTIEQLIDVVLCESCDPYRDIVVREE